MKLSKKKKPNISWDSIKFSKEKSEEFTFILTGSSVQFWLL